jgi:preprotein translocase subunit YajC
MTLHAELPVPLLTLALATTDGPTPAPALALVALQETPPATGGDTPAAQSPWGSLMFPMLLVFAIFYFVMIGPERKKRELMLAELKKGDRVLTTGGMFAVVAAMQDDVVTLQIDDGVRVRFSRASIQSVIEPDSSAKGGSKGSQSKDA